ncbi:UDP:flavonoid glycosyltransferase YjiC (YdhE family) [Catenuloplanes nepalensis]|uniref:UDP:flavonoid glycosyltransferase YjiC (YdhE family) n=1 Tax=Catenuloplanes nepalensis TaxID=587533 RepID=A0ABT9MQ27_9ACTN|nr:glycosyltransferase [Catenuloplanes nepalensis]MDP9793523.1 UDP:flavonoid glycosyltransferase YjiC (YdhE family) [Catenuloplanes nepalensis]
MTRIVFAGLASPGHAFPMVPLAVAAREAGHDVWFAAGDHVHAALAAHGLRPFRPADSFYEIYAEDLEPELDRLAPDLVIHGWGLPGAAEAARRKGIRSVWHGFGRLFPDGIGLARPSMDLPHLDICPPSLQSPELTAPTVPLRPVPYAEPGPQPVARRGPRPLVFLTMGTAFNTPELLATALRALSGLDATVIASTGNNTIKDEIPDNAMVRPWVAQAALLPVVDLVVHHGGSGTMLGALAHGVPQLILPQGADQFANAAALSAAGAAIALHPAEAAPNAIAASAQLLLVDRGGDHRTAARAIAKEIAAMPSPAEVMGILVTP